MPDPRNPAAASPEPAAATQLDDPTIYPRLDPADMYGAIRSLPTQLRAAPRLAGEVDWRSYKPTTPAGVCLCGMGGSAIGGDLARSYWDLESPVPFVVIRNDRLPGYINRFWLVIASSYSGNTEETLAAATEAKARGCQILALTTGGTLAAMAQAAGWPLIRLPAGLSPRAALGYSFGPVILALGHWGIAADSVDHLQSAADFLDQRSTMFNRERPLAENAAKQTAAILHDHQMCIYGTTGSTDVVAYRFKGQLCENAKVPAFANALPELLHNEIVGMDTGAREGSLAVAILKSQDDSPRATARLDWVEARLCQRGVPVVTLIASGKDRLQRLLSLVQIGDYISYYLAILGSQNPTPVPAIADLKRQMGTGAPC
ncbi:MAG: bifunctional phosphoglucose/phosphomannose isomerase [candidate division Zixibacteria bacterium]|nr:bifunctional phosphoglucose/phosphomannose isomerase [candidate division Zixibacteria bacterium]